jgi:Zn-dependent protease
MSADRPPWESSPQPALPAAFSFDTLGTAPAGGPVLDPVTAQAARILENPPPERTWVHSLILLVITLFVFAAAGAFRWTPADLALLVAILLLHESGHYLGMRLFNYQDVKMFFIPFFGAAVSGRSTSVEGYKEAIVLLLGPLPGILLGLALAFACIFIDSPLLRSASLMLIWLNGFNLLPLMPLDGGRILHLILFSRQRHVEAIFRVVTAALLGLFALTGAWALGIFAVLLLIGTPANFQIAKLAQQLRRAFPPSPDTNPAAPLPHELAVALVERVRSAFPQVPQPANLANLARQVWERIHLRPPGLAASVLLLGLCAATILGTPIALALFQIPLESYVSQRKADGSLVQTRQKRVWGTLYSTTELNADLQFHGRFVEYFPYTDRIRTEGTYAQGLKEGTWTSYDDKGQVAWREEYHLDVLVPPALAPPVQPAVLDK